MRCAIRRAGHLALSTALLALGFWATACSTGVEKYGVSGSVTWKDEPVADGTIVFSDDNPTLSDSAKIAGGRYEARLAKGKKKVQVFATKESGKVDPAMGAAPRVPYIPAEYNDKSSLSIDVTPGGPNRFDFHLPLKK